MVAVTALRPSGVDGSDWGCFAGGSFGHGALIRFDTRRGGAVLADFFVTPELEDLRAGERRQWTTVGHRRQRYARAVREWSVKPTDRSTSPQIVRDPE
jgi:hypothetical protein